VADDEKRQRRLFPQISLYLPDDILDTAERIAIETGRKRSSVLRDAVIFAFQHVSSWLKRAA
jgi:metal-responsive CopG/Arc/MetJ family transcriptional regulator